jgi:hypothetical protein
MAFRNMHRLCWVDFAFSRLAWIGNTNLGDIVWNLHFPNPMLLDLAGSLAQATAIPRPFSTSQDFESTEKRLNFRDNPRFGKTYFLLIQYEIENESEGFDCLVSHGVGLVDGLVWTGMWQRFGGAGWIGTH